ncbi:hypothetical protein IOD13_17325 [Brevibacterium casei]|nr:hypothetical protein [Brevibacterium casei]
MATFTFRRLRRLDAGPFPTPPPAHRRVSTGPDDRLGGAVAVVASRPPTGALSGAVRPVLPG